MYPQKTYGVLCRWGTGEGEDHHWGYLATLHRTHPDTQLKLTAWVKQQPSSVIRVLSMKQMSPERNFLNYTA